MTAFPQQIKGSIFSMDGVIVDTTPYHYVAWSRLARELGFEFSEQQHFTLRGLSRMESLERILDWGGMYMTEAEKLHWADVKNNWYQEMIVQMKPGEVLPGVLDFLKETHRHGLKMALSSGSRNARLVLRSTQIETLFDAVVDGNDIRKPKPDPHSFLIAAAALGLNPADCVVFEDLPEGVEAALRGGFFVVGVGDPAELSRAHFVIPGFQGVGYADLMIQLQELHSIPVE
jgi:beta-phosphoglucomutase